MSNEVFELVDPGLGAAFQDGGRPGWKRFGVPPGGWMDAHAADWANRLLNNPPEAPVLELTLQGAVLRAVQKLWIAVTGADADATVPLWRAVELNAGDTIRFPRNRSGVWTYLAVESGFDAPRLLGSASVYRRGHIGRPCVAGEILCKRAEGIFVLPSAVAGRLAPVQEVRDYSSPPVLEVWPGPEWNGIAATERDRFFSKEWTVSPQSDRVGYRLSGPAVQSAIRSLISSPVRTGSIQVPPDGQPIVTMRDGPTVGGYPRLGLVHPSSLSWLAQCRPGQKIRFQLCDETRFQL